MKSFWNQIYCNLAWKNSSNMKKQSSKIRSTNSFAFSLCRIVKKKSHQNLTVSTAKSKLASGIYYLLFALHNIELGYRHIATICGPKIVQPTSNTDAMLTNISRKSNFSNRIGATSFVTFIFIVCLETILLSTMSNCAKTFYMHWNTSNSIFRIDNTDHIIDVNKGNLEFEYDQVHIICPEYDPGTFENETEKYIIYNVSKVEYETCRITNSDPRVIAICDKPQKLMFFTITFRPFTPQPGGLEFLPGNDYYFISTSSKDDLYRRIGGRCSTNNMKVVFKVCCESEIKTLPAVVGQPTVFQVINSISSTSESTMVGKGINASIYANNRVFNLNSTASIENRVLYTNNRYVHSETSNHSDVNDYYISNFSVINKNSNATDGVKVQLSTTNVLGNSSETIGLVARNYNDGALSGVIDELIPHLNDDYHGRGVILINNVQNSYHKNRNVDISSNDGNAGNYNKLPKKVVKNDELTHKSGVSVANCIFCRSDSNLYRNILSNNCSIVLHMVLLVIICNIYTFYF